MNNNDFHHRIGERLKEHSDSLLNDIADATEKREALERAWGSWDAEELLRLGFISQEECAAILKEKS